MLLYWGSALGGIATLAAIFINLREEKRKERFRVISGLLSNSLRNFDISGFSRINEYARECKNNRSRRVITTCHQSMKQIHDFILPDTIPFLIEKANSNNFLEMEFLSGEKDSFHRVLEDINKFTEDYISLLRDTGEHSDTKLCFGENGDYWVEEYLGNSSELCRRYNELSTSVGKALTKYGQL